MSILITPLFIITLYVLIRSADIAITSRADLIRAIIYGIVAILAIIAIVLMVVH